MGLSEAIAASIAFTKEHQAWAPLIVFLFAFVESLAFLSLLVPSTVILFGIGGIFGASDLPFAPLIAAGGVGAGLGYAVSYWLGLYYKEPILKGWPFKNHPEMVQRGHAFFEKYGAASVFIGHFLGPVRAVIPVIAGVAGMPALPFQIANVTSGFLWTIGVMGPGYFATSSGALAPVWAFLRKLFID